MERLLQVAWKAFKLAQKGKADFVDFLSTQINLTNGCKETVTLDCDASEINGATLLAGK